MKSWSGSGKTGNFRTLPELESERAQMCGSLRMADEAPLRTALATTWTVYLATHRDVDAADGRRCLLERHLQRKWETSQSDAEQLVCSGLAFLDRTAKDQW
jgi:hypothetical protein